MPDLRIVADVEHAPIPTDADAIDEIQEHWKAARHAYSDILRLIGTPRMRLFITGSVTLTRREFEHIAEQAHDLTAAAAALADRMDRSVTVFERRHAHQRNPRNEEK